MKVNPASVHFRAKTGFSLSYTIVSIAVFRQTCPKVLYKAITRMYSLTALLFGNLNYAISVQVGGSFAEIYGIRRAQGMLGLCIWVGVEGGGPNTIL